MSYNDMDLQPYEANDNRIARVIAHGGTLFSWFLAPLIVYLVTRGSSPRVAHEAFQALCWSALGTIVSILTFGAAIPLFLAWHLYAAYKAWNGEEYNYPLVADFAARHE